ncbi:M56 family metallopeptidase [Mucilaginibacter mali]|uniref:M56 family metallopeptidase n=1 Tax=Mucilaginibacter mali TaxID=2740462 RepID=A0A7D4PWW5_9SPHI|nr:M56 family metallopeptidase [Mucilaginibacter mali]QKJ32043.1 M56 family metallopeptidase [Mucilaginibacter mali]
MTWWHYLLLVNVYLTLFFVFYAMLLRRETFFNLNRVYLVSSALLSFCIPVIQSSWIKGLFITKQVQETIHHVGPSVIYRITGHAPTVHQLTLGQIIGGIYVAGILILTIRFFYQLAVINWVISQPKSDTSYSFFKQIKIEQRDTDSHNDVITAHEEVHARQWHTADLLLMEAIMIINWFNPVVYLYRNAVKYIHEFIADRDAVKAGTNKAEYAMLLLSQTFVTPPYHLVNPFFNSSLLKQRIQMLNKNRSHWMMLVKYGFSAPLFALMLILSSATVDKSKTLTVITNTANNVFHTPAAQTFSTGNISAADQADLEEVIRQHQQGAGAQSAVNGIQGEPPVETAEQSAEFPGGIEYFNRYLSTYVRYPAEAKKRGVQGKVFCSFVVEKDGSISNIKVVRGIGAGADEEAVRVIAGMPKWNPGMQNGVKVRQLYTVPISFVLADGNETFTAVEQSAMYPGGMSAFGRYLGNNIRYPQEAREKRIQGKVYVSFVVEKDGSLSDVRALRDIGGGLGDEAVRVIEQSPRWNPGMQNGNLIRQRVTTPVSFTLTDDYVADNHKDSAATSRFRGSQTYNYSMVTNNNDADNDLLEARFTEHVKASAMPLADSKTLAQGKGGIKPINLFKEKAEKNLTLDKAANGVVSMVTKHKSFFDLSSLGL